MAHVDTLRDTATALQTEILARRYYECFNQREFDVGERYVHSQAVLTYPLSGKQFIGRAGYRELARRWIAAFPDGTVSIISLRVSHGPTVRLDWVAHGTFEGPLDLPGFAPIPPTGIHTHLSMRETIRLSSGLIVESTMQFDPDELRRHLSA